jgi:hypothetical protein
LARPTSDAGDATSDDSGQSRAKGVTLKVTRLATGLDHP